MKTLLFIACLALIGCEQTDKDPGELINVNVKKIKVTTTNQISRVYTFAYEGSDYICFGGFNSMGCTQVIKQESF